MTERYVSYIDFDLYTRSETTVDASLKHNALEAGFIAVDAMLVRRVELTGVGASATPRVFTPDPYTDVLFIDDCSEITAVSDDGSALTLNTDVFAKPDNALFEWGESAPYDTLVRRSSTWRYDGPRPTVTVSAKWGWPGSTVPPMIIECAKIAGKAILEGREIKYGLVALAETGGVGERDAKIVVDTFRRYRGPRSWGL